MSRFGLLATVLRELAGRRVQPRGPSPLAVLGETGLLRAMREGGQVDGRTAAGYAFHSACIGRLLQGRRHCLDLGCGSGVQLLQLAAFNPAVHFTGIDRSELLLEAARADAAKAGLTNVEFLREEVTGLPSVASASVDAVVSTMTLHHLPDTAALQACLRTIARVLQPGGAVYLEDFGRLKHGSSVEHFVSRDAPEPPDAFSTLYRLSLHAAFTRAELTAAAAACLPQAQVQATAPIPFLVVIKTAEGPGVPAPGTAHSPLAGLQEAQRRDLAALRQAFALGGWRNTPGG